MTRSSQNPRRNGGKFKPYMNCPGCGEFALHYMRNPNPDPPTAVRIGPGEAASVNGEALIIEDGRFVRLIGNTRLSRWDERPFEVVRVCVDCGHEWGCT